MILGSVKDSLMVVNVYGGDVGRDTDVTLSYSMNLMWGKPMVLGGISYDKRTNLVFVPGKLT